MKRKEPTPDAEIEKRLDAVRRQAEAVLRKPTASDKALETARPLTLKPRKPM